MRISDWSSDVCSSDLGADLVRRGLEAVGVVDGHHHGDSEGAGEIADKNQAPVAKHAADGDARALVEQCRSEERRVGNECVSKCRSRWVADHSKKKNNKQHKK